MNGKEGNAILREPMIPVRLLTDKVTMDKVAIMTMEHYDQKTGCVSWQVNGEHIQRSRVRIDTRKWLASKLVPRMYGDAKEPEMQKAIHEDVLKRKDELDERNKKEF